MSDFTATELQCLAGRMLQEVLRRTHLSAAPALATVVAEEGRTIGADPLVLYLLDHEQKWLVPVPGPGTNGCAPLAVRGTVAGRAFASNSIIDLEAGWRRRRPSRVAAAAGRHRAPRRGAMVPPQVLATDTLVLAAMLEPCYDIGGDAYDYAINDHGVLHVAVFGGMGHGLAAAAVTAFALSAYRHGRRRGDGPAAIYAAIDAAVFEQYPQNRFVTGLIAAMLIAGGDGGAPDTAGAGATRGPAPRTPGVRLLPRATVRGTRSG